MTNKLAMFRIKGDKAAELFQQHPEAADRSPIKDPETGMTVEIGDGGTVAETLSILEQTFQLIKDGDIEQSFINTENVNQYLQDLSRVACIFTWMTTEPETTDENA